VVYPWTQ
nr:valorphin [cattle, hypothalamic tissue, Peptide, 7 aa] [Bos taurus]